MEIKFPKLYRYKRMREHCQVAIPFAQGELTDEKTVQFFQGNSRMPSQNKVTSRYKDGSIRYLFARFMADLPANKGTVLEAKIVPQNEDDFYKGISVTKTATGYRVQNDLSFEVVNNSTNLFEWLEDGNQRYTKKQFVGPYLEDVKGIRHEVKLGIWEIEEEGPLVAKLRCMGSYDKNEKGEAVTFEIKITAYAEKNWIEIAYRIINSTEEALHVVSLVFAVLAKEDSAYDDSLTMIKKERLDSTGCGDKNQSSVDENNIYNTTGVKELEAIQEAIGSQTTRTCAGRSNYKTNFCIGKEGKAVNKIVDAKSLVAEANEHFAEVFYGTFFADRTDSKGGVCATIFQAQQNYPKAVKADESGVYVMLVPKDVDKVVMASGMSREQKFLLHFHAPEVPIAELDNRSLIYQMPDKPSIAPKVFRDAGVMPDIFVDKDKIEEQVEISLIGKCDEHARCYGMLNFGDSPDQGYTTQGRGGGLPVWTNNEYDFPHACAMLYARTGERRFLDYVIAAGSHWMDVDVCHYSKDPLIMGGQWEHTRGHCEDGVIVCSHEWVEGLLDLYHFTGEERALCTAIGIGENVLRLLDTPMFQKSGESNARETGWALRTLTALYVETHDEKWISKCDWIVGHFKEWKENYGGWIATYTDNTLIRVGFMISVAVGSLMRYYRVFPNEEIKDMLIEAVDDLVENCLMDNGLFYYKELPSLKRLGNNTLLLEALTIAYELTGDVKYLQCGIGTFRKAICAAPGSVVNVKEIVGDAVIQKTVGTKQFAQSFLPLSIYYKAMADNNLLANLRL